MVKAVPHTHTSAPILKNLEWHLGRHRRVAEATPALAAPGAPGAALAAVATGFDGLRAAVCACAIAPFICSMCASVFDSVPGGLSTPISTAVAAGIDDGPGLSPSPHSPSPPQPSFSQPSSAPLWLSTAGDGTAVAAACCRACSSVCALRAALLASCAAASCAACACWSSSSLRRPSSSSSQPLIVCMWLMTRESNFWSVR